jgi:hypothetical protein
MSDEYNQDMDEINERAVSFCKEYGITPSNYTYLKTIGFNHVQVDPSDPDSPWVFAPASMVNEMFKYQMEIISGLVSDNKRLSLKLVNTPSVTVKRNNQGRGFASGSKGEFIYKDKKPGVTWRKLGEIYDCKNPLVSAKKYALSRGLPFPPLS